ncbi:MAG: hypothetical protein ACRD1R_15545 [Acidobacteriota bacterium]
MDRLSDPAGLWNPPFLSQFSGTREILIERSDGYRLTTLAYANPLYAL